MAGHMQDEAAVLKTAPAQPGGPRAAVRLSALRKVFGHVAAVDGVDLEIAEGEFFTMLGPSGSGKTTLLRLIAGLARPDSGRIRLGGDDLFDSSRRIDRRLRDRRIGMIFQDDRLFPHLSVASNIRFGMKGWRRGEAGTGWLRSPHSAASIG